MIARIVHLYIDKKHHADFLNMFKEKKEIIRGFEGCQYLNLLSRELDDCIQFTTFSHWESADDLEAYRKSDVFGNIWPQTKKWMVAKPQADSFQLEFIIG